MIATIALLAWPVIALILLHDRIERDDVRFSCLDRVIDRDPIGLELVERRLLVRVHRAAFALQRVADLLDFGLDLAALLAKTLEFERHSRALRCVVPAVPGG